MPTTSGLVAFLKDLRGRDDLVGFWDGRKQKIRHANTLRAEHISAWHNRGTRPHQARGTGFAASLFKTCGKRQGIAIKFGGTELVATDPIGEDAVAHFVGDRVEIGRAHV